MKKLCLTALLAMFSVAALPPAVAAEASSSTAKHAAPKKKAPAKKAAVAKEDPVPEGAELWSCAENEKLNIAGNMKRDAVLTMAWKGKNYKLPRQTTTTGADRFYDAASGLDLVVIPSKAMLFSHREHGRLADECKTQAMTDDAAKAPTQSNELLK
ncbi:hypothetical protein PTE30175_02792 [Pandoraea terrae]|uniref:Uncharacterized protein n=1 Tax=Pandoraea terrae TaxID=1537710 RepID=A0A5E4VWA8_9BURK|nr:hypothetical protein [Pandoraea terrae]VVE15786.1 hypothetical protein PTE30175_02792 [Pandoraea terrae]